MDSILWGVEFEYSVKYGLDLAFSQGGKESLLLRTKTFAHTFTFTRVQIPGEKLSFPLISFQSPASAAWFWSLLQLGGFNHPACVSFTHLLE